MRRPALALLAVLAAGGALVGVGEATRPQDRPAAEVQRAPQDVPVLTTTALCPDVRQVEGVLATRVSAGIAGTGGGQGAVVSAPLASRAAPTDVPLTSLGTAVTDLGLSLTGDALAVTATGALAPGLEVEAITRGASGASRGLAGLRCPSPSTDQWFVGGGTRVGETTVLVLANADREPALVDVTAFGEGGQADDAPGRGVVVPARGRRLVPLNALVPDLGSLVVRVQARRGRVAGGVLTSRVDGRTSKGLEWAAAVEPPSRRVVVPGLVQGPGSRRVLVANPTDATTTVSLQLTTTDGQANPAALTGLAVPARRVLAVDLTERTAAGALAVTVLSTGAPVLAAGLLVDGDGDGDGAVADMAYAASAPPLRLPAMLADVTLAPAVQSTLVLSAVDGDAVVRVTGLSVPGNEAQVGPPVLVRLPGGASRALALSELVAPGATARLAVQVEVLSGTAHASRYLREDGPSGPLVTSLALRPAAGPVPRPQVAADSRAGRVSPGEGR